VRYVADHPRYYYPRSYKKAAYYNRHKKCHTRRWLKNCGSFSVL
jgi:hypothetical protein